MIIGAHGIIHSKNPEADRAFLRDLLKLSHVDAGGGHLIFALPPAEIAIHESDKNSVHELYLMCEDVAALVDAVAAEDIVCGPIQDRGWGLLTQLTLPGGGAIGVYEPRHARPSAKMPAKKVKLSAKRAAKRRAKPARKATKSRAATKKAKRARRQARPSRSTT